MSFILFDYKFDQAIYIKKYLLLLIFLHLFKAYLCLIKL